MLSLACFLAADAVYVSIAGRDSALGTAQRPVQSISRAVELARASNLHRIVVDKGEYLLRTSIQLDARDSGLTIEARPGTHPLITGAIVVPDWLIARSNNAELQSRVQKANSSAVAYEFTLRMFVGVDFAPFTPYGFGRPVIPGPTELFADATPLTIARWPNEGYTTIKSIREAGNGENDRDKLARKPVFTAATDRAKAWKSIENAWLYGYWKFDWADETIKLDHVDPATGEITLATPHTFGVDANIPFFAENLPEELDAIGEYYVDPAKTTIQFVANKSSRATYRVSLLGDPLVSIDSAHDVVIRGLDFAYSRGDGASVKACEKTRFEGCQFYNLGERGVNIIGGHDSGLLGCNIWNTAEGGATLDGGDRATLTPAHNYVDNCDIHHYQRRSQTYRPAVGIAGVGQRVSRTSMHDAPHSAIIFGGNDHIIESCEFYRTISRTGDGGVVYTGRDWTARGTEIRDNYLHDNIGQSKWEPAIYFDDLASGLKATGNVIERCHWGFLIGGGRDNIVTDNEIIDCKLAFHCDARGLGWAASSKPTMMERLLAVPYQGPVWSARYPSLPSILDNSPMAPAANVLRGNTLINSGKVDQDWEDGFRKTAKSEDNIVSTSRPKSKRSFGVVNDPIRRTLPKR